MESDAAYLNKSAAATGSPRRTDLRRGGGHRNLRYFTSMDYERQALLAPACGLTFSAGHILGSALGAGYHRGWALGAPPLHRRPRPGGTCPSSATPSVPDVDYLIIESTYGGRAPQHAQDAERQLAASSARPTPAAAR